jgi:hypothetical protein
MTCREPQLHRWVLSSLPHACRAVSACGVVLFATAALAQRTEFRDKNGNPNGYIQQEGNRSVLRDNSGNPHGYWQQEGNSLVHRDNAGNLLDRQQIK